MSFGWAFLLSFGMFLIEFANLHKEFEIYETWKEWGLDVVEGDVEAISRQTAGRIVGEGTRATVMSSSPCQKVAMWEQLHTESSEESRQLKDFTNQIQEEQAKFSLALR